MEHCRKILGVVRVWRRRVLRAVGAVGMGVGALTGVSWAAPLTPLYYDMPNGDVGSFTYWDDGYTCAGIVACSPSANNTSSGAPLFGGKGDLTDGVIATQNWFNTPGLYVGWASFSPPIHFVFPSAASISSVRLYFDDANGSGRVSLPGSVTFTSGVNTLIVPVADPVGSAPVDFAFDVSSLGATGSIDVRLNPRDRWVFMSEATFDEQTPTPVPEPASFTFLVLGGLAWAGMRKTFRTTV